MMPPPELDVRDGGAGLKNGMRTEAIKMEEENRQRLPANREVDERV